MRPGDAATLKLHAPPSRCFTRAGWRTAWRAIVTRPSPTCNALFAGASTDAPDAVRLTNLGLVAAEFGADALAQEIQREGLHNARQQRIPAVELLALGLCADLALNQGRFDAAIRSLEEALPLIEIVDSPGFFFAKLTAVSQRLAMRMLRPELGAYFDAERMLESSFECGGAEFISEIVSARVERYVHDGRQEDAATCLRRAIRRSARGSPARPSSCSPVRTRPTRTSRPRERR